MGNPPDTKTVRSPLLATPPEILLLIAESVADVSTWPMRLASLGIDLGNPELWDLCADIMGSFPQLDELVLSGCYPKRRSTRKFLNSELGTKFRSFKGTSVVLRRVSLTCTQAQILIIIGGSNVKALMCLECDLSFGWGIKGMWLPKLESFMCTLPSIRRKSFTGPDVLIDHILAPIGIYPEIRVRLAHFEWAFGSKARLWKDRTTPRKGPPRFVKNWTYCRVMSQMLITLQFQTCKSLEVFIDGDSLGGDMVDIIDMFVHAQGQQWEKLKLLVFRCDFPQDLTIGDESTTRTVENGVRASENNEEVEREHPIWKYVVPSLYRVSHL